MFTRVRSLPKYSPFKSSLYIKYRRATTFSFEPTKRNTMLLDESTNFEAMPVRANMIPSLQRPEQQVLWIGCSDSCFQETKTLDLLPDEMLVHRNLGNMLIQGDMSSEVTINHAVANLMVIFRSQTSTLLGVLQYSLFWAYLILFIGQAYRCLWSLWMWYCPIGI